MNSADHTKLEDKIGYRFQNKALLKAALTHSSAGEEKNYERLEFLGDRVLGLITAELLYKKFPDEPEGHLAKRLACLVQGATLAEIAATIDLGSYIHLSDAERSAGGADNNHILADSMEALIGAIYRDSGLEPCRTLIEKLWKGEIHTMKTPPQHPKTELQELLQSHALPLPLYTISDQTGPDHAPVFEVTLSVKGFDDVKAQGRSRQMAEKEAAKTFLERHYDDIVKA